MERITGVLDEIMNGQEYVDCDDFLEAGLLDSMDVMDLVDENRIIVKEGLGSKCQPLFQSVLFSHFFLVEKDNPSLKIVLRLAHPQLRNYIMLDFRICAIRMSQKFRIPCRCQ